MSNIVEKVKKNKEAIVKKVVIGVGALAGLALTAGVISHALSKKDESEVDSLDNEEFSDSSSDD